MPCAASDHAALALDATALLAFRDASVRFCPAAIPRQIVVVAAPDLVLSLSGTCDRAEIPAGVLAQSHIANHLVRYLRTNAAQLGLGYVSGIIYDHGDSKPKLIVRSGHPSSLQVQRLPTCATLVQLELAYIWQTSSQQTIQNNHPLTDPFAQILSLPYQTLLDAAVERFVNRDLVKRYPLIFGPWHRQLGIEASFFPVIHRSIRGIIDRSPNFSFKEKCGKLFMVLRENLLSKATQSTALLSEALDAHDLSINLDGSHTSTSELDMLCLSMEHLFQDGMPPPKFKGSNKGLVSDRVEDEELSQKMSQCSPDEVPEPGEDVLWELHSEHTPNDMGVSMDNSLHSSYERFPFGLYEPHFQARIHQNKVSGNKGPGSPPNESSPLDWDSDRELLQDLSSDIHASAPDTIFLEFNENFCQQNGDIQRLGKAYCKRGHLLQPPSLCESLMADDDIENLDPIQRRPVGETSGQEPLFAMDETQDSAGFPRSNEWATENLFAQDESREPRGNIVISTSNFSGCGTFDTENDIDLLSEASTESTTSILNHES